MLTIQDQNSIREVVAETIQPIVEKELKKLLEAVLAPLGMRILNIEARQEILLENLATMLENQKLISDGQRLVELTLQEHFGNEGEEWRQ